MQMNMIYVWLMICISTMVSGHLILNTRQKRQAKDKERCLTSEGTWGECLLYDKCITTSVTLQDRPSVCRWETTGPVICCPIEVTNTKTNTIKTLTCGLSQTESTELRTHLRTVDMFAIAGGIDAQIGKWPWMALIFLEDDIERQTPICGASLINEQTLLTAAHCFLGSASSKFVVRLGEHNLASLGETNKPIEINVEKVIIHSGFNYPSLYNDIAILHLETKATVKDIIQLVCLPKNYENETFVGKNAVVTGWGHLEFGGNRADKLQELQLPVLTNEHCQKKYETLPASRINLPQGIIPSMMCAGIENEKKDACQGDSGGPLVFQTESSNWIQIGIVSSGYGCGAGIPGIYTRVTAYLDWIVENTMQLV